MPWLRRCRTKSGELIVDMRSGAYAAAWKPKQATLLGVRAFGLRGGKRKPVTHMAKAVRGEVARALLLAKQEPKDPQAAAAVAREAGFTVELNGLDLDVIVQREADGPRAPLYGGFTARRREVGPGGGVGEVEGGEGLDDRRR